MRIAEPVFGSVSAAGCWADTTVGCDQVVPPSDDEMKEELEPRGVTWGCRSSASAAFRLSPNIQGRTPVLGLTTTWLPMVWLFHPGSKIARVPVQVLPPSVHPGPGDNRRSDQNSHDNQKYC